MLYKHFYSELGKLLYAVADIDGVIKQKEKKKFQEIVKKVLVPSELHKDKYGTNAAYYSEIEFDFLEEEICDAETAFSSFIDFVELHHTAFDEKMKMVCLQVATELATVYKGSNKKEKALIEILTRKLEKTEVGKWKSMEPNDFETNNQITPEIKPNPDTPVMPPFKPEILPPENPKPDFPLPEITPDYSPEISPLRET